MEELLIQQIEKCKSTEDTSSKLALQAQALRMNLENHIGNKIKISFLPNQYYNDKIYLLANYEVNQSSNGINVTLGLKEDSIVVNYKLDCVIHIEEQSFFNRIEYKAYTVHSEAYEEVYHFCLYF